MFRKSTRINKIGWLLNRLKRNLGRKAGVNPANSLLTQFIFHRASKTLAREESPLGIHAPEAAHLGIDQTRKCVCETNASVFFRCRVKKFAV